MAKDNDNRSKLLAALITLLLWSGIIAIMLFTNMSTSPDAMLKDALEQQLQEPVEFGGEDEEFVQFEQMLAAVEEPADAGEQAEDNEAVEDNPPQEAGQNDLENQGTVNEAPQPPVATNTNTNSPMEVKKEPPRPTKPQKETTTQVNKPPKSKGENKQQTTPTNNPKPESKRKPNAVDNAFNKGNKGNTPSGNPNGSMGKPTIGGGLGGYTEEYFPTERCPGPGTVIVRVWVSTTGTVSKAVVIGGTLKGNAEACATCRSLALKSRFKVPKSAAVEGKGTLTYTVK